MKKEWAAQRGTISSGWPCRGVSDNGQLIIEKIEIFQFQFFQLKKRGMIYLIIIYNILIYK